MSAIVSGEYVTFKHIKTRKMVVLEIEVPEEMFQDVITKLGMPIGGESKPVAVALLNHTDIHTPVTPKNTQEQTEGDKLRVRAVMLCRDDNFVEFCNKHWITPYNLRDKNIDEREKIAVWWIYHFCNIESRSELTTNIEAQNKFKELLEKYKTFQLENQYADNLERI